MPSSVQALRIRHSFGSSIALDDLDLDVQRGELLTLLGSSGSGKTTLLRILGGLVVPTSGRVVIDGRDVTDTPPRHRQCGIVFQNYALFPHLSVFDNIAFPLRLRRVRREDVVRRVNETIRLVDLSGFEARLPGQLSGGQQQRVAVARAVVFRPRVLLMDEPLGSLDKSLRDQLQIQIRQLQQRLHTTTVYVTHDQIEAFALSDRVALLRNGRLAQIAAPEEIYRKPATIFVARFVGDLSMLPGTVLRSHKSLLTVQTDDGVEVHADSSIAYKAGTRVVCGLRPESVLLHIADEQANPPRYPMRILAATFQGGHTRVTLLTHSGKQVVADVTGTAEYIDVGAQVDCSWSPSDVLVYPGNDADQIQLPSAPAQDGRCDETMPHETSRCSHPERNLSLRFLTDSPTSAEGSEDSA